MLKYRKRRVRIMKKNLISALIATFIVYLDIVLKIIYTLTDNVHAQGDYWYLAILISIAILLYLCYFKDSLILQIISLILSVSPIIIAIVYFCTFKPLADNSDWGLVLVYMLSEIILLIPIYVLQIRKIRMMYNLKI